MPKVLAMNHQLSNAEVLHWLKQKRLQHDQEDADDRSAGKTPSTRPSNYARALEKHEHHLTSASYPYVANPSAYEGKNQDDSVHRFGDVHMTKIQEPLLEKYKTAIRDKLMTVKEAQDKLAVEQEQKELTDAELLMVHNHAPMAAEMLQPMIEDWEKRFSYEEMEVLVECIKGVFRADEMRAKEEERDGEPEPVPTPSDEQLR